MNVAFRVVCANRVPDHATVARFRVRHREALAGLFGQVLSLCARAGLVRVGVDAVDGSKFRAAASDSAIRSYEEIAAEVLAEAAEVDAAEDERFGEARGDELPEHLSTRGGRRAWLREAKQRIAAERNGCGSILDARFEGRRSLTVLGVAYEVDVYRCGAGRGRQIRREAAAA